MSVLAITRKVLPFRVKNYIGLRAAKYLTRLPLIGPPLIKATWGIKLLKRLDKGDLEVNCGGSLVRVPWDALPAYINVFIDKTYEANGYTAKLGETVLDIGAYTGISSLYFSSLVGPTGSVIAVEPSPDNLEYLRLNSSKVPNITLVERALSDIEGETTFYLGRLHAGFSPYREKKSIKVRTTTLDNLLESLKVSKVDFIKLNTAFSLNTKILDGAAKTLSSQNIRLVIYVPFELYNIQGRGSRLTNLTTLLDSYGFTGEVTGICIYARKG